MRKLRLLNAEASCNTILICLTNHNGFTTQYSLNTTLSLKYSTTPLLLKTSSISFTSPLPQDPKWAKKEQSNDVLYEFTLSSWAWANIKSKARAHFSGTELCWVELAQAAIAWRRLSNPRTSLLRLLMGKKGVLCWLFRMTFGWSSRSELI